MIIGTLNELVDRTQTKVRTLEFNEWGDYVCKKSDLTENKVYPGMAFRVVSDQSKVWYLDAQSKMHEIAPSALASNYIVSSFIYTVPDSAVQGFARGDMIIGTLNELVDRTQTTVDCNGNGGNGGGGNGGNGGGGNGGGGNPQPSTDRTVPTVSLTAPAVDRITVENTIPLSADASDNVGVTKVEFLVNDNVVGSDSSAPYSISWDTKTFASNVTYVLRAKAYDAALNSAVSAPLSVTVRNAVAELGKLKIEMLEGLNATPIIPTNVLIGTNTNVLSLKLTADKEPIQLRKLTLNFTGSSASFNAKDIDVVNFYDEQSNLLFTASNFSCSGFVLVCTKTISNATNLLPSALQPGSSITVVVRLRTGVKGQARIGDLFRAYLDMASIEAYGVNTQQKVKVVNQLGQENQILTAKAFTQIIPVQGIRVDAAYPLMLKTQLAMNGALLGIVKLSNPSDFPLQIRSVNFIDAAQQHGGTNTTYKIYRSDMYDVSNSTVPAVPFKSLLDSGNTSLIFSSIVENGESYYLHPHKSVYFSAAIDQLGGAKEGDVWRVIVPEGGVGYLVHESDIGYDGNGDGVVDGFIDNLLYTEGRAEMYPIVLSN
jgi:hypothetical protein